MAFNSGQIASVLVTTDRPGDRRFHLGDGMRGEACGFFWASVVARFDGFGNPNGVAAGGRIASRYPDQIGIIRTTGVCVEVPIFGLAKAQDVAIQEQELSTRIMKVGVDPIPIPYG